MAHDVFISYASKDKPIADAACAAVEAKGFRCWIAPRDVLPGMSYGEAIIKAVQGCRVMVQVFSSNANVSAHIPKEVERAVSNGVTIIPLRIEDVAPAQSLDYFIGSVHWLDAITPPLAQHLNYLAETISKTLSIGDTRPQVASEAGALLASSGSRPIETSRRNSAAEQLVANVLKSRRFGRILIPLSAIVVCAVAGVLYFRSAHAAPLSDKDTIVLADFTNSTGDPVFDGTLRQGLAVQLEQSPFLSLISEDRIQQTLRQMGQKPDARITPLVAREICQRTESAGVLDGSIASLGSQYVLGIKAVNCRTGDSLAEEQATAEGKEQVLKAVGDAAARLRKKLGESLSTVQKLDTPIEQATTPSLEALQAYSLGRKAARKGDATAAVPLFQRAIRLDPNFAVAYLWLGTSYDNLGEPSLAAENTRKAYELRERLSDREKLGIEAHYHDVVTGDLRKARQAYELIAQTYPRATAGPVNLSNLYSEIGQYNKAVAESREALRLDPAFGGAYINLVSSCLSLNRLEEARTKAEEAEAKKLDSEEMRFALYELDFLQNDDVGMAQQVAWAAGMPGVEDVLLGYEAATAAYTGRLGKAREFSRRAVASAELVGEKETAAGHEADAALREALFGNAAEARQRAAAALGLSNSRDAQFGTALALAFAGDASRAQTLADKLANRFPENTVMQFSYLPTLRAQLALSRNDSSKAIESLQVAATYELGTMGALYPVYVRGAAYLAGHQGSEAASEFLKILDHRGVVQNQPIGALAHLQLARAYTLQGDTTKARAAYNDFLSLWKDADPDIPILKQAKAENAKLQ